MVVKIKITKTKKVENNLEFNFGELIIKKRAAGHLLLALLRQLTTNMQSFLD